MKLLAAIVGTSAILLFDLALAVDLDNRVWRNPKVGRGVRVAWAVGLPAFLAILFLVRFRGREATIIEAIAYVALLASIALVALRSRYLHRHGGRHHRTHRKSFCREEDPSFQPSHTETHVHEDRPDHRDHDHIHGNEDMEGHTGM